MFVKTRSGGGDGCEDEEEEEEEEEEGSEADAACAIDRSVAFPTVCCRVSQKKSNRPIRLRQRHKAMRKSHKNIIWGKVHGCRSTYMVHGRPTPVALRCVYK